MPKRIMFVNPPYERIAPGYDFVRHVTNRSPSLGLLHLAAHVREHGYEPSIIESDILGFSAEDVVSHVQETRPEYVGLTLFTVGVHQASRIALGIKKASPETTIVVGGPHISSMGKETLSRFSQFDMAVVGEGEETLIELLGALEENRDLTSVTGILCRRGDEIVETGPRRVEMDLDLLPFPAWDLLPDFPGAYKQAIYDYPRGPVATIAASRGCPFHCKFCDTSTFGAKVRAYSPRAVFDMMKHLKTVYGVRHIMFVDDLFLASRVRVTELCEILLREDLNMTWTCAARVDTVKPDILALMQKAGCWEISFGLETGSDELLQKMDKAARVEKSEQAVVWTEAAGIRTKGLFMLGYPGETKETIELTKDFVRRIPMHMMNLTKFTPYPGSPVYIDLYGTKIRPDHWEKMNGMNFLWSPPGMTTEELDRRYQEVILAFYRRPHVMLHYFWMTIRYPNHLLRLARLIVGYGLAKIKSIGGGRRGILVNPLAPKLEES